LVVERTGAAPTLLGGGEFVLEAEIEAEMIEALSEIISLTGVSGRMEPERAEALVVPAIIDGELSVFGVGITRRVLGAFLVRGEDTVAAVGVGKAGNAESLSEGWEPTGLI
jgi:hypothetical protein